MQLFMRNCYSLHKNKDFFLKLRHSVWWLALRIPKYRDILFFILAVALSCSNIHWYQMKLGTCLGSERCLLCYQNLELRYLLQKAPTFHHEIEWNAFLFNSLVRSPIFRLMLLSFFYKAKQLNQPILNLILQEIEQEFLSFKKIIASLSFFLLKCMLKSLHTLFWSNCAMQSLHKHLPKMGRYSGIQGDQNRINFSKGRISISNITPPKPDKWAKHR